MAKMYQPGAPADIYGSIMQGYATASEIEAKRKSEVQSRIEKREAEEKLLEKRIIDNTGVFENQVLKLSGGGDMLAPSMRDMAHGFSDMYAENEKLFGEGKLSPKEYRDIKAELWNTLSNFKVGGDNLLTTLQTYKNDYDNNLFSKNSENLKKAQMFESVLKGKAIWEMDETGTKARMKVPVGKIGDNGVEGEVVTISLEELMTPESGFLKYDKKASLDQLDKMVKLLPDPSTDTKIIKNKELNQMQELWDIDKIAPKIKQSPEINNLISTQRRSILEDYMGTAMIDREEDPELYEQQTEEIYNFIIDRGHRGQLNKPVNKTSIPRPRSVRTSTTAADDNIVEQDIVDAAVDIRNKYSKVSEKETFNVHVGSHSVSVTKEKNNKAFIVVDYGDSGKQSYTINIDNDDELLKKISALITKAHSKKVAGAKEKLAKLPK